MLNNVKNFFDRMINKSKESEQPPALDPNLLRSRWLFNLSEDKTLVIMPAKDWQLELAKAGIRHFNAFKIPPKKFAHLPHWYCDVIGDNVPCRVALDEKTKVRYARLFKCKPIKKEALTN